MGRILDENAVLKEIGRWIGYLDEDMIERIKIGIKKLPEAQQWIPCSERLPDKNCRCLTTNDAWGAFEVDWNAWIDGQWLYPNEKPVAWMPLPEPWKGEQ